MISFWRVILVCACVWTAACSYASQGLMAPDDRHAVASQQDVFGDAVSRVVYLDQGWDATDSLWFYNTTQGSNLLPYDLFLHLEQPQSHALFRDNANLNRYRYLPQLPHWDNPDGLPVGFLKDSFRGKDYIGLTCAACHTAQLNYKGEGIRIDGGPSMADMESFLIGLQEALAHALQDPAAFERLVGRVVGDEADAKARGELRARVQAAHDRLSGERKQNQSAGGPYGYARLDAVGRIFNRVLSHVTPGDATNFNPSNAPVSYPFLWDTPLHDFVQWNGLISNEKNQVGARNVGEVMGTFATFDLRTGQSSVVMRNLIRLERQLREKLYSPEWPSQFPKIDQALAAAGKVVFERYRCHTCHADIGDRKSADRRVIAQLSTLDRIGTDRGQAHNAAYAKGRSGLLEGKKYARGPGRHEAITPVNKALGSAIKKVMTTPDYDHWFVRRWLNLAYDLGVGLFDTTIRNASRHVDHVDVGKEEKPEYLAVYKARPLNGVWATAPFLHNGSVPNLYELFLPSCNNPPTPEGPCRSSTFTVGSREFDPSKVGFVNRDPTAFPGVFVFDTRLPGNSNAGHEYSTGRTPVLKLDASGHPVKDGQGKLVEEYLPPIQDADRWALVEYLKSL